MIVVDILTGVCVGLVALVVVAVLIEGGFIAAERRRGRR